MEIQLAGKYISILNRLEQRYLMQVMKGYGLGTTDYMFLLYLNVNPGCTQRQMCSELSLDIALATRSLGNLEKKGFLVRKNNPKLKRGYEVYLTEQAKVMIPEILEKSQTWWQGVMQDENMEDVLTVLERMSEHAKINIQNNINN